MRTRRGNMPDSLSTAASAGTGLGQVSPRPTSQVKHVQLVVASQVVDDPREAANDPDALLAVRDVLRALGICNKEARVEEVRSRTLNGLRRDAVGRYQTSHDGEREPNGRLSRARKREKVR